MDVQDQNRLVCVSIWQGMGMVVLVGAILLLVWCQFEGGALRELLWLDPIESIYEVFIYWLFALGAIFAAVNDCQNHKIPNEIALGGMVAGMLANAFLPSIQHADSFIAGLGLSFAGAMLGLLLPLCQRAAGKLLFGKYTVGFGDIKFMGGVGAFWGWRGALFTFAVSLIIGGFLLLVLLLFGKVSFKKGVPFAPYISAGAIIWALWGDHLWMAYWSLAC